MVFGEGFFYAQTNAPLTMLTELLSLFPPQNLTNDDKILTSCTHFCHLKREHSDGRTPPLKVLKF